MSAVVTGCLIGTFPLDNSPQLLRYHTDHVPRPIPYSDFNKVVASATTLSDERMVGEGEEGASSENSGIEIMVSRRGNFNQMLILV